MYHKNNKHWGNSKGETYDLSHLEDFEVEFEIKLEDKSKTTLKALVMFSNTHCYTKEMSEGDQETIKGNWNRKTENRSFCPDRWEFSKQIPDIMRNLNYKACMQGNNKAFFYRQERTGNQTQSPEGWYICFNIYYKKSSNTLEVRINSAHYRVNRPEDVRGAPNRFGIMLSKYMKGKL